MIWHYTTIDRLLMIRESGKIRRARTHVPRGERPAVWFSTRSSWEPTATKIVASDDGRTPKRATIQDMVRLCGGLARLGVSADAARYTWADHRRQGGILYSHAEALEQAAREQGADPAEWRLCYRDMPLSACEVVELSADGVSWCLPAVWAANHQDNRHAVVERADG